MQFVLHLGHVVPTLEVQIADLLHVLLDLGQVEDLFFLEVEDLVDLGQSDLVVA